MPAVSAFLFCLPFLCCCYSLSSMPHFSDCCKIHCNISVISLPFLFRPDNRSCEISWMCRFSLPPARLGSYYYYPCFTFFWLFYFLVLNSHFPSLLFPIQLVLLFLAHLIYFLFSIIHPSFILEVELIALEHILHIILVFIGDIFFFLFSSLIIV